MRAAPAGSPEALAREVEAQGISVPRVLEALRQVRRADFVPAEWKRSAYQDGPIPIAHGQVTTQPSLVARMVEALQLEGTERVLEVGTGLGFQAAVLAKLTRQVFTIEWFEDLADQARRNLATAGIANVTVVTGDGTLGLPGQAPFDAIVVAAAAPEVPPPLVAQLAEEGRLVHPAGPGGDEVVTVFVKRNGKLVVQREVTGARFVPLLGAHGVATGGAGEGAHLP
ncbi:MAG: protein-L-isoaspartate(D-aspartate) O-methyltransferase [Myxococcaceae bacterium]